jgi:hypothetical protein
MDNSETHGERTYVLVDAIGITEGLRVGTAADLLARFWRTTENWTNNISHMKRPHRDDICGETFSYLKVNDGETCQPPELRMTVIADTAILTCSTEYVLHEYYELAESLVTSIKEKCDLDSYFVVNRASELPMPEQESGSYSGSLVVPSYVRAVGIGPAWRDLYKADSVISCLKKWHSRFHRYCVGDHSLVSGYVCVEREPMKSLTGAELHVLALNRQGSSA